MALYHMPPVGRPLYRRLSNRKRSLPGCRPLYGGGPDGSRLSFDHRNGMQQVSAFIRNRHLYSLTSSLIGTLLSGFIGALVDVAGYLAGMMVIPVLLVLCTVILVIYRKL